MKRWQELQKAVEDLLTVKGYKFITITNYVCYKCKTPMNRKAKGWPDYFVYYPRIFAIECKTGKGKLSKVQIDVKWDMEAAGIPYLLVRDNVDILIKYLAQK